MAITKICDGYYYGTQEELKPLLLGGAEKDAIYCAVDTGAIYKGTRSGSAGTEPIYLSIRDKIHRQNNNKVLVNGRDLSVYHIKRTTGILSGEKPFKLIELPENLLVKNSKFEDADQTNGYTRKGGFITHTNEQSTTIVKGLKMYADEVGDLAIVMANLDVDGLSSGAVKVGYIDNSGDNPEFIEVKSIGSCNAGSAKYYRNVKVSESAAPHYELAIELSSAAVIGLLVVEEKYVANFSSNQLADFARYDAFSNILDVNSKSGGYQVSDYVEAFTTPDFMLNMSVLKAAAPVKANTIEDNTYSDTAGESRRFTTDHEYAFCGRTADYAGIYWVSISGAIAEVEF